jgi:hypothetical protein
MSSEEENSEYSAFEGESGEGTPRDDVLRQPPSGE